MTAVTGTMLWTFHVLYFRYCVSLPNGCVDGGSLPPESPNLVDGHTDHSSNIYRPHTLLLSVVSGEKIVQLYHTVPRPVAMSKVVPLGQRQWLG
jgi:hypothetical protein